MLALKGLSRRYGGTLALDELSLEVPEGEVVGFVGPNGAGKTTARRIALGVLERDAGEVLWRGAPANPRGAAPVRLHAGGAWAVSEDARRPPAGSSGWAWASAPSSTWRSCRSATSNACSWPPHWCTTRRS